MRYLPLLLILPIAVHAAGPTILYDAQAEAFIRKQPQILAHSSSTDGVGFEKETHSLLGTHYYFQQNIKGIPVEDAQMVVSVKNDDKRVYRVYNNTVTTLSSMAVESAAQISETDAYDIAWKALSVRGYLMSAPSIKLVYRRADNQLTLVYKINLAVSEPFGYYEIVVGASNGKILSKRDVALTVSNKKGSSKRARTQGPLIDRNVAFDAYRKKTQLKALEASEEEEKRVDGQALVFDPDPRTALQDNTLQDNSAAERFEKAYVSRTLKEISVAGNKYSLKGPWVSIQDFEPPTDAPSTTPDGNWNAKRGKNAFDDVMAYYHIDQSQRYIQSLGFTGTKGIQNRSIPVDSDGVNGDDNSHFVPSENRIAFGHGCVNDTEDSDVILHEYGHALQHAMNSNWYGGDTGAMGEGFGDYWAASYSMTTQNGWTFLPDEAFQWDGHGEGNKCWPGRTLNAASAKYDPKKTYDAHQRVGSFESDELWSTPLFQSLRELMSMGYKRENVDQIVLESHFGLGANITMRDMAKAIVQTAQKLFPNDPYADVFQKQFMAHNILEIPHAALELKAVEIKNAGDNNVLDPGETVDLYATIVNTGNLPAQLISLRVSSSNPYLSWNESDLAFADVAAGAEVVNTQPIRLSLASAAPCGEKVDLTLTLTFSDGTSNTVQFPITLVTGVEKSAGGNQTLEPGLVIPDNDLAGVTSSIWLNDEGMIADAKGVSLSLEIRHKYTSDLKVSLVAPSGVEVVLINHGGSGLQSDLVGTYPTTLKPVDNFSKLVGESLKGEWKLKMVDDVQTDKGTLKNWSFKVVTGHQCSAQ